MHRSGCLNGVLGVSLSSEMEFEFESTNFVVVIEETPEGRRILPELLSRTTIWDTGVHISTQEKL